MITKSSMAPYGDRASALEAYTGAGGTGRESERGDRAWSLAGTNPESSQHMDVSPASREKRRGVYPVSPRPEHRGAGGKSVSEDRVCPSDPIPGMGMLQPKKITKAPWQSVISLGDSHPSPNHPGQPGNAPCQPKECQPKRERCGALAPPELSLPAAPHPSSLVKAHSARIQLSRNLAV